VVEEVVVVREEDEVGYGYYGTLRCWMWSWLTDAGNGVEFAI
jgi:hypothetical protein